MNLADTLLSAYVSERRHRRNPYPRCSAGFAGARHVTKCHGAPTTTSKRGDLLCETCRRIVGSKDICELRHLDQRGSVPRVVEIRNGQRVEVETMRVAPTRVVDRDAEDRAAANGASRLVALARIVEPRPREMRVERWEFTLTAWALYLDLGRVRAAHAGREHFRAQGGTWSPEGVRYAVEQGRDVVGKRAARRPMFIEELIGRWAA
jgi:hypothetical protein